MLRLALVAVPLAWLLAACGPVKGNCSSSCAGCCDDHNFCQTNFTASACGKGGTACVACKSGESCDLGTCTPFASGGGSGGSGGGGGTGGSGGAGGGSATGGGSGGAAGGGMGGAAGGGAGGGTVQPIDAGPTHFNPTMNAWAVPATGLADGFIFPRASASVRYWDTIDLDGDGKPDLVHTTNPATGQVWTNLTTGAPYWKFYKNTGTGFTTVPALWPVPTSGLPDGFLATAFAGNGRQWATFDIDNDGKPDLVQTANFANNQIWPGSVWRVYKNTGAAFALVATNWSVPTAPALQLPDGYNAKDSAANPRAWSTLDLDGDGAPDLVLTSLSGVVFDAGMGKAEWHMHKNVGNGFAAVPTLWPVPATGLADGFTMPNSRASTREWQTFDLDGDGLVDLVHTANTQSGAVFTPTDGGTQPFWRFYKNLGTGFAATPVPWPVPFNGFTDGFYAVELLVTSRKWSTKDMNGDGRPDLIHTTNPSGGQVFGVDAGMPYWNYFRNTGSGFVLDAGAWAVPVSGTTDGFSGSVSNVTQQRWQAFDLDGDGVTDLVHTTNPATDTVFTNAAGGPPIWKLYRSEL